MKRHLAAVTARENSASKTARLVVKYQVNTMIWNLIVGTLRSDQVPPSSE
jgi:hypothetical protein